MPAVAAPVRVGLLKVSIARLIQRGDVDVLTQQLMDHINRALSPAL